VFPDEHNECLLTNSFLHNRKLLGVNCSQKNFGSCAAFHWKIQLYFYKKCLTNVLDFFVLTIFQHRSDFFPIFTLNKKSTQISWHRWLIRLLLCCLLLCKVLSRHKKKTGKVLNIVITVFGLYSINCPSLYSINASMSHLQIKYLSVINYVLMLLMFMNHGRHFFFFNVLFFNNFKKKRN